MNKPARNKSCTDRAIESWRKQIIEQQASGQEPGEFCRQRSLCSTSFYAWRKRLGMNGSTLKSVVNNQRLLPEPLSGVGFLRLDPAGAAVLKDPVVKQRPRVMWIETPGGYRVAVNGGVGLAEVFGLLKTL